MKLRIYSILFIAAVYGAGCKKTLDVSPYNGVPDATAYSTPAKIESSINGVYDAAQSGFYAGGAVRGYPFGAANIEQGDMRGEDMVNDQLFYQVTYEATYTSTSANQQYMFETLYSLINKANLAIDGVTSAVSAGIITDAVGKQYLGECRFLRAFAHHELVINFARPYLAGNGADTGIIYRNFAVNSDSSIAAAKKLKRTMVSDNYTKILEDLDYAEVNLPATSAPKTFRASKAAAIALKMRAKLHMGNWAGVITEGAKLVPATVDPTQPTSVTSPIGSWALLADPNGPFISPYQSAESIFSIKNDATDNGGVNGALPNMLGNPATGGRGLVKISPIIYNLPAWTCDDKRRGLMVNAGSGAYYSSKYKDPTTSSDAAPQIRYAEVLLMLAEAEARNATVVSTRALDLLNVVRNRSLASPTTQQYLITNFATKNSLIQAILDERRIEFLGEGKRWSDIHRLATDADFSPGGIPAKIGTGGTSAAQFSCGAGNSTYSASLAAIPYSNYKFIWPIPLSEIQQNPNFSQNPKY